MPLIFIAELFTTARTWKQLKHSPTEKWIKKVSYTYTMEYYSAIKNNEISSAATRGHVEVVILSDVSQTGKDKYHLIWLIYGIQKKGTNELIYKTEIELWM